MIYISPDLEGRLIDYLSLNRFVGKVYPVKKGHSGPGVNALLIPLDNLLDQVTNRFQQLAEPATFKRFSNQESVQYFKPCLTTHDLRKLLERNNILVFKTIEDFVAKKQEYEKTLTIMNKVQYLRDSYHDHCRGNTAA